MKTLSQITWPRRPLRELRVIWHIAAVIVTGVMFATAVEAGPRHARVSSDLSARLNSASTVPVDVIVSGSADQVARIASRHGLSIRKTLSSGAVLSVPQRLLAELSEDADVDVLSGNAPVHSHAVLTTDVTGAEAAWSGAITALGP